MWHWGLRWQIMQDVHVTSLVRQIPGKKMAMQDVCLPDIAGSLRRLPGNACAAACAG